MFLALSPPGLKGEPWTRPCLQAHDLWHREPFQWLRRSLQAMIQRPILPSFNDLSLESNLSVVEICPLRNLNLRVLDLSKICMITKTRKSDWRTSSHKLLKVWILRNTNLRGRGWCERWNQSSQSPLNDAATSRSPTVILCQRRESSRERMWKRESEQHLTPIEPIASGPTRERERRKGGLSPKSPKKIGRSFWRSVSQISKR